METTISSKIDATGAWQMVRESSAKFEAAQVFFYTTSLLDGGDALAIEGYSAYRAPAAAAKNVAAVVAVLVANGYEVVNTVKSYRARRAYITTAYLRPVATPEPTPEPEQPQSPSTEPPVIAYAIEREELGEGAYLYNARMIDERGRTWLECSMRNAELIKGYADRRYPYAKFIGYVTEGTAQLCPHYSHNDAQGWPALASYYDAAGHVYCAQHAQLGMVKLSGVVEAWCTPSETREQRRAREAAERAQIERETIERETIERETIEPESDEDWPALSHAAHEYAWLRRTEADAFERMVSAARTFEAARKRCDAMRAAGGNLSIVRLSELRIAVRERYNTWIQASSALHESAGTVTALVNLVDEIVEGERWAR